LFCIDSILPEISGIQEERWCIVKNSILDVLGVLIAPFAVLFAAVVLLAWGIENMIMDFLGSFINE
jgi:hypothetical protein